MSQFFGYLFTAFPDFERMVEEEATDDNQTVVTRWISTGTHRGEHMGIAPTGKRITFSGISIQRIADGTIVEEWQQ